MTQHQLYVIDVVSLIIGHEYAFVKRTFSLLSQSLSFSPWKLDDESLMTYHEKYKDDFS